VWNCPSALRPCAASRLSLLVRIADAILRLTLLWLGVLLRLATRPRLSRLCYHPLSPPSRACAKYNWRREFVTSDHVLREYVRGVPQNFLLICPRNIICYIPPPLSPGEPLLHSSFLVYTLDPRSLHGPGRRLIPEGLGLTNEYIEIKYQSRVPRRKIKPPPQGEGKLSISLRPRSHLFVCTWSQINKYHILHTKPVSMRSFSKAHGFDLGSLINDSSAALFCIIAPRLRGIIPHPGGGGFRNGKTGIATIGSTESAGACHLHHLLPGRRARLSNGLTTPDPIVCRPISEELGTTS
jgi:hypothetical protein